MLSKNEKPRKGNGKRKNGKSRENLLGQKRLLSVIHWNAPIHNGNIVDADAEVPLVQAGVSVIKVCWSRQQLQTFRFIFSGTKCPAHYIMKDNKKFKPFKKNIRSLHATHKPQF